MGAQEASAMTVYVVDSVSIFFIKTKKKEPKD